jgi:Flp pilus assembly protein TadG
MKTNNKNGKFSIMKSFRKNEKGAVAILTALMAPLLVGALAIGVDVVYWRYRTAQLQVASDAAAFSIATDIGNNITTLATLQTNAGYEAVKNGCGTCTVTVTYPYLGNASSALVVAQDTNAIRFLSGIYTTSAKSLVGRSVASSSSSSGGGTTSYAGSACILQLDPNHPGGNNGIIIRNNSITSNTACEIVSNSSQNGGDGSQAGAIDVNANASVFVRASAVGTTEASNGGSIAASLRNNGISKMADPYASQVQNGIFKLYQGWETGNGNVYNNAQSCRTNGTNCTIAGNATYNAANECIELISGANAQGLNFDSSLANQIYLPANRGYSYSTAGGRSIHNIGGGGGRFCNQSINIGSNDTINLGPGVWYIPGNLSINSGGQINGTGNSTTTINNGIPYGLGQTINGVTLLIASSSSMNLNENGNMAIQAPSVGPTAGIAISQFGDDSSYQQWSFQQSGGQIQVGGAFYAPTKRLLFQNSFTIEAIAGSNGQAITGCMQLIGAQLELTGNVYLGNNCASYGVQPFGTSTTSGWQVTTTGGTSTGSKAKFTQ